MIQPTSRDNGIQQGRGGGQTTNIMEKIDITAEEEGLAKLVDKLTIWRETDVLSTQGIDEEIAASSWRGTRQRAMVRE